MRGPRAVDERRGRKPKKKKGKKLTGAIRAHQEAPRPRWEAEREAVEQQGPVGGAPSVGEAQVDEVEAVVDGGGRHCVSRRREA